MTDFDSDDFLRELHNKLHDFGAAPPDDAWANIQRQLPQQKKDRRPLFYLSAAAAVLLLGVLSLGSWLYLRPTSQPGAGLAAHGLSGTSRNAGGASAAGRAGFGSSAGTGSAAGTSAADAARRSGATAAGGSDVATSTASAATAGRRATTKESAYGRAEFTRTANASTAVSRTAAARSGSSAARLRRLAARSGRSHNSTAAMHSAADAASLSGAARASAGSLSKATSASARAKRRASRSALAATAAADAAESRSGLRRSRRQMLRGAVAASAASADGEATAAWSRTGRAARAGRIRPSGEALEPVAPAVARPEPEEPEVRRSKRNRAPRPTRRARILKNLTANVLVGSALSYRQLSGGGTLAQRQLASLERPALGYSAHVGLAYALNKRLKVSLGLGYTDYATRYLYQVQKGDGVVKVDQRDVYRFITMPVQVQYQLAANHRYSVGWLAGASLGAYAGGRTTTGTACNCLQSDAPASDEGYRTWAVAATAGGYLEYYLNPDVRLLLRPTLQYQLNSLTDPAAGLVERRPWSVGLQTGLSFNLKDKPRPGAASAKR
ncbi:outer membrane beta-barrel protein [Hymenobacter sp. CRA2]|uniref:outer membrane beta-barrel protein n=1 Tax=Hymenobacter sp. CRA2 TaxID=1955620 RepID=UPI00098FDA14|nr:outer membrane beta-barrel protein [Hymenobacter sp. CRA2]OON67099.1 hypothetical protein B0919_19925 [Hymenobacter sp. CRA2]